MSRRAKERASRLAEYREAKAAYDETGDPKHGQWMHQAMRSKDVTTDDFVHALDRREGEAEDKRIHGKRLIRKYGLDWSNEGPPTKENS